MSYMTTPTNEEIAQLESQTRQNLIECAKRALHVFKTDDYRVTVRGAVTFELQIKVQSPTSLHNTELLNGGTTPSDPAPTPRNPELIKALAAPLLAAPPSETFSPAELRRLIALTRQDCARAEFGGNGNFHDWTGLAKADDLIKRVQQERKP